MNLTATGKATKMEHAQKLLKQELGHLHFIQKSNHKMLDIGADPNCILVNELTLKDFTDQTAKKIKDIEIALKVLELFEVVDAKLNANE